MTRQIGTRGTKRGARRAGIAAGSVVTMLAMLAAAAASAQEAPSERIMERSFEVRSVDTRVVETWIWDLCDQRPEEYCSVHAVSPGNPSQLTVRGNSAVIAKVARLLAERDAFVEQTQSFQIILVAAGRGGGMDPALPPNAVAALEDVKQFLPFDSFRVLDTALLSTTRHGETALSGPDDLRYEAGLRFHRTQAMEGPVIVVDELRVVGLVERDLPARTEEEKGGRTLLSETVIDTSLSVTVGETAVVGTSRLDGGDEALIVLLTALPAS